MGTAVLLLLIETLMDTAAAACAGGCWKGASEVGVWAFITDTTKVLDTLGEGHKRHMT